MIGHIVADDSQECFGGGCAQIGLGGVAGAGIEETQAFAGQEAVLDHGGGDALFQNHRADAHTGGEAGGGAGALAIQGQDIVHSFCGLGEGLSQEDAGFGNIVKHYHGAGNVVGCAKSQIVSLGAVGILEGEYSEQVAVVFCAGKLNACGGGLCQGHYRGYYQGK